MHCLSSIQELHPRLESVQRPRRKRLRVLPKPSQRDLWRIPGTLRERLPGTHVRQKVGAEIRASRNQTALSIASTIENSPERSKHSETSPDPGSPGQIRRTRGVSPANRRETPKMKSNGHDPSAGKVNGHGPVSPSRTAQETEAPPGMGGAASDDARDLPTAAAASSAAAGKERDACAEVAPSLEGGTKRGPRKRNTGAGTGTPHVPSETNAMNAKKNENRDKNNKKDEEDTVDIPPGSAPLPEDGVGFVDAMHAHVDLYLACARLVKSTDEKIAQRMMERLLEMSYGKSPAASEEQVPQIIFDAPQPIED